jgi:hypothetical protein
MAEGTEETDKQIKTMKMRKINNKLLQVEDGEAISKVKIKIIQKREMKNRKIYKKKMTPKK